MTWLVFLAACSASPGTPEATAGPPPPATGPVQTATPNADTQKPAIEGQTRAPQPAKPTSWKQAEVARGLETPWSIEPLPDGRLLVTERPGRMRIVTPDGKIGPALTGLPAVDARAQGGLLDVALSPDFATSKRVFWSYAEPRGDGGNGTSVASGVLGDAGLTDVKVIFRQEPGWQSVLHFGSRLAFAPDGNLFVTLGERSQPEPRELAQDLGGHLGKVVRIRPDGSVPQDNPFVGKAGAKPEIWSYGHRNVQSATTDAAGRLWTVEHGPKGGDELNHPEAGKNYGWPVIAYGEDYSGKPIGEGRTAREGMEQPVYYWDPVIAPCGMASYDADLFPGWKGSLLVGGMVAASLVRLEMRDGRVASEEWLPLNARIRDVKVDRDGSVLVITDEPNGRIIRITPA